jgi:effector-binding domain-containing protein
MIKGSGPYEEVPKNYRRLKNELTRATHEAKNILREYVTRSQNFRNQDVII